MTKLDELSSIIKIEFLRTKEPIPLIKIIQLSKELYSKNDLPLALRILKRESKIKLIGDKIKPMDTDYLRNMVRDNTVDVIKDDNIIWLLTNYGSMKPSQLADKYIQVFSPSANVETITRRMRKMFEEGKLNRQQDVYFIDRMTTTNNLNLYTT